MHFSIIGPTDTRAVEGLLDTGADDTVFPDALEAGIGLDLSKAPTGQGSGIGMTPSPLRYARVTLRLVQGMERHEWEGCVAFTSIPLRRALLGYGGFLQYFTATFHGDREEVELATNSLYPGS